MWRRLGKGLIWLSVLFVAVVTFLPALNSSEWWIRMWEFPRVHVLALAGITALLALPVMRRGAVAVWLILLAASGVQAAKIYPFTPLAPVEIAFTRPEGRTPLRLLTLNVLRDNHDYARVIALIEREAPDVLLLMETDLGWVTALEEVLAGYDTVLREPLGNYYGMVFATRLQAESAELVYPVDDMTPAALAQLRDPDGRRFQFLGLHPRPPVPGTDTDTRDAQILKAADFVNAINLPAVVMGDFNDVAWSWTAGRYKHHGDFKDPRVGRGLIPSFDATHPLLRFPIDQLYLTDGMQLVSFGRGPHVGSDHFPILAEVLVAEAQGEP